MTRLHVGPGVDDWDDDEYPPLDDPTPTKAELRQFAEEITAAAWDALWREKRQEGDRWAS